MGVNWEVSSLVGNIEGNAFSTYQKGQQEIKNLKADTDFKSILDERINSIDKEENFSSENNKVIEKKEKTVGDELEKVNSETEEKINSETEEKVNSETEEKVNSETEEKVNSETEEKVNSETEENSKLETEESKTANSDNSNEDSAKDVTENISYLENEYQKDDQKEVIEQNSAELALDINPDDIISDDTVLHDDLVLNNDLGLSDNALDEEISLEVVDDQTVTDNSTLNFNSDLSVSSEELTGENSVNISIDEQVKVSDAGSAQDKNFVLETEIGNDFNPQDNAQIKQTEGQTTEISQTPKTDNLKPQPQTPEESLSEAGVVANTEKLEVAVNKNEKKADKISDQQIDNEEIAPVNTTQNEVDLSFSQEQSPDSSLADKHFEKITDQITTENKESSVDGELKDFTVVAGQPDSEAKTKTVKAEAEVDETNFKEIFQQKVNADEIIKQVQAKLNVRAAGNDNYSEIRFRLNPDNLGEVSMKITMENNSLTARMRVENESVKEVFEANFAELKKALDVQGVKVEKIEVTLKNDTSNMGNFSESNSTHERDNKRNSNPFSRGSGNSNANKENDNNITLNSRSRRQSIRHNDGHVDYLA